jgi:hypothetical protein
MLLVALALVSIFCAFWCTFMLRYPTAWSRRVDQHQRLLRSLGLDLPWMHRMERGRFMMALVTLLAVITLMCVVTLLHHPTALADFWRDFVSPRSGQGGG